MAVKPQIFTPLSGIQRISEAVLIAITIAAAFLMLALLSYNPADPGWSQTAWEGEVHNLAGATGSWLADITMFTFGVFSYLVPFLLVLLGWGLLWKPKRLLDVDYLTLGVRIVGFVLTVLGMSAIGSMNFNDLHNFSAGGLVGDVIASAVIPLFGRVGANLMLLCFVATGVTMFTGWSWLTIVERIGATAIGTVTGIYTFPMRLGQWLNGGWRRDPREEGPDPLIDAGGVTLTPEDEDELAPRLSMSRPARKRKADVLPELDEDTFQFEPDFDDDEDEIPAPRKAAPARRAAELDEDAFEDDDLDDMPWAGEESEPARPAVPLRASALKPKPKRVASLPPLPSLDLLDRPPAKTQSMSNDELERMARLVEAKLADYNVQAKVVGVYPGPVITRFELDLAPGMKASKITNLSRDLARSLSASSVRVVEVIPGKTFVGLELPNRVRQTVYLREVLDCPGFSESENPLTMVLGQDIAGSPVVVNLAKMPHLLVAGTTGSGKSVGVNTMILSMLYKASPDELRFIMIDPKMLELSVYEGIPHLLTEVVTDMKDAANALRWCVGEMERRYKLMSAVGVRNLKGYNAKVQAAIDEGDPLLDPLWRPGDSMDEMPPELEKLPHIVVVVDEFADMMMIVGKKVEELIARIAQKARAAGIHLILATQRPSVDVITGLIKANIPTRISFQVSSKIDSRTILDQGGAESLLGMGDMLYMPAGTSDPVRVHGAFVDDHEVHKVVADWKQRGEPNYIEEILSGESGEGSAGEFGGGGDDELDPLFDEAVAFVVESRRGSTSSVQRKFKIGYNRAARIIDQMQDQGIVSSPGSNGQRDVLAPAPMRD
ncbi:DNA translocase FtsK 4TM domain-containing protein [Aeromonas simiae]|uniref:DNA translocase FtsK n=1 Tax=Aeromonas simiae TaxID=218936 RepID=UPI00266CC502|nr:DNA translocase FtsK 4TM domain-containing protein [Aeromonas simiae]MDO2948845.1 DNA translocase FtsK 4TM domain-containing protein [Aeromonas simiae]MDO2956228.1 DNA translocase FtsK 4TM domain-containing protein [Aeromonas simiae]